MTTWPWPSPEPVSVPDDYEPTDADLGAYPPTDPYNNPSYDNLTYPKGNTK